MNRVFSCWLASLVMLCVVVAPGDARAQTTDLGTATATIVSPLSISKYADLDFGTVTVLGAGASTITLDPNAAPAAEMASTGPISVAAAHAASFGGATVKKTGIIVRIPKGTVAMTRSGGTETLTIRDFTLEGDPRKQYEAGTAFRFRVGGTLDIPDGAIDGVYEGTFAIEVQYP